MPQFARCQIRSSPECGIYSLYLLHSRERRHRDAAYFGLHMRRNNLYASPSSICLANCLQKDPQGQQVDRPEGGTPGGDPPERVRRLNVGKRSRNGRQRSVRRPIDQPILAPMLAAADKLERLPGKWMERMRDPHRDARRADTSCSRRLSPRRKSSRPS